MCDVGQDAQSRPAVSYRHKDSGRAVGLRQHANIPRVIQSDDCGLSMDFCICYVVCGILGELTKLHAYTIAIVFQVASVII